MIEIINIVTFSTACYYLASRAEITRWAWSRYPRAVAKLLNCPACLGFWAGAASVAVFGADTVMGVTGVRMYAIAGVLGLVLTPPMALLHTWAWSMLGDVDDANADGMAPTVRLDDDEADDDADITDAIPLNIDDTPTEVITRGR